MKRLATVANATYTLPCWQFGCRLLGENLQSGRMSYGKQILVTVSQELTARTGPNLPRLSTALREMQSLARHFCKPKLGALFEGISA